MTRPLAVAGATLIGSLLAAGLVVAPSSAAWQEQEYVTASSLGVIDCATTDSYSSTASGDFLEANLLGASGRSLVAIDGVTASVAAGGTPTVDPPTATDLGGGAYANPLSVSVLNNALAIDLAGVLSVPLGTDAGLLNQYARVATTGTSAGASGAVGNSGAIDVARANPGPAAPTVASLSLDTVIAAALGTEGAALVGEIASLDLRLGAVAALAVLDMCQADYTDSLVDTLRRDYLVAGLDLDIVSPLVTDLSSTVAAAVAELETTLNSLGTSNTALVGSIAAGVGGLLTAAGILDLTVSGVGVNLVATSDFSAVRALLDDTISDSAGLVRIDLATGTVRVDTAALFDGANGLNGLPPNSEVLINAAMVTALESAVAAALGQWAADVSSALDAALAAITLSGTVTVDLAALGVTVIRGTLTLSEASLSQLVTNSTTAPAAVVSVETLVIVCPAGALDTLSLLVCPLVGPTTAVLTDGLQGVVGSSVQTLLDATRSTLSTTLSQLTGAGTSPLVDAVSRLTAGLFGAGGVASLLVNVQNDPLTGWPEPASWAGIPNGRFDVAALRLEVLGLLGVGSDVELVLARGSVGPNVHVP